MIDDYEGWTEPEFFNSILARFLDSHLIAHKICNAQTEVPLGFRLLFHPARTRIDEPYSPEKTAIVIDKWIGRFGNNVLQLRSAYLLAKLLGAQKVIAPALEFFETGETNHATFKFGATPIHDESAVIVGEFFPTPFKHFHQIFGESNIADFYNDVRPRCNLRPKCDLTDSDLILFIRSGDIFTINQEFIRGYGQPPLSFYEKVIEIEQPKRIFVLAEDDANPIVHALMSQNQSNTELVRLGMRGDFEFMLGAKKIATGTTTMMPNLLNLSTDIQRCYTFVNGLKSFDGRFINTIINDNDGHYKSEILSNNWTHSPEQLRLMVEYPISNLGIA